MIGIVVEWDGDIMGIGPRWWVPSMMLYSSFLGFAIKNSKISCRFWVPYDVVRPIDVGIVFGVILSTVGDGSK